jgi:glucose 1-dehydrogenase
MTTDDTYFERGINLRHGFLTEYVVDEPEYIIRVPENMNEVGVLMEPMSVAQKAIEQAYRIQQRLRVWRAKRAAVMGSGTLGIVGHARSSFARPRRHHVRQYHAANAKQ